MLMQPNKPHIRLLVDALRSGNYTQGHGYLVIRASGDEPEEHCCLGVATVIAQQHGVELERQEQADCPCGSCANATLFHDPATGDKNGGVLLPVVRDFYGFESQDPELVQSNGHRYRATRMNDNLKSSFAEIADAFERTYLQEEDPRG
jgi:hypothetical protein